jgi:hypothetical protein
MQTPIMTDEQAQRIVHGEVAYVDSWLESMKEQFGDSFGVQIGRFGNAFGFVAQGIPDHYIFNRVIGLTTQDEKFLDDILKWYSKYGVPCQIDLSPHQAHDNLFVSLAKHGLYPSQFYTVLYGTPSPDMPLLPPHITVREVRQEELDLFSNLHAQGFFEAHEGSNASTRLVGESMKGLYGRPGWHLYLAFVEEIPAATAVLYIQDQIASLSADSTVPQFRGRGCHTALIQQRIAHAARSDCDLVITRTEVGTVSQRNMERVGMHIAYTRPTWKLLEK